MELKPIPELTEKLPGDRLIEFYRKLGWSGTGYVDGRKVRMHSRDWQELVGREMAHARDLYPNELYIGPLVGMMWVDKGPSSQGETPGMVELLPGWLEEARRDP